MTLRPDEDANNPLRTAGRREGQRRKDANHAVLDVRRERHLVAARRVLLTVLLDRGKQGLLFDADLLEGNHHAA